MTSDGVIALYDSHPINEFGILEKLKASGVDLDALTQEALAELDQDNYGGRHGVERLAMCTDLASEHHVLDVCSGMGGPARWLAHRIGCRVTGIDLTQSRVAASQRLTERVGLNALVEFVQGNATEMAFPDQSFDRVISQEAWLHIPAKEQLVSEVVRVLKLGGLMAFTDIVSCSPLSCAEHARLTSEMQASRLIPADEYIELLEAAGCEIVTNEDLSSEWTKVLANRLEMYRSLKDTTLAKFGEAHFERWDSLYAFYVGLFVNGTLGGARITARRARIP
jgi:ubiquinone/menaquinone biosynthesis C-methylase UbiE